MDARFEATPSQEEVAAALALWPELAGKRLRPLLVSAFGDIFVELESGEIHVADPLELTCERVASSATELEALFSDPVWARERLVTELALLANERGIKREAHQVFGVAPHPCFTGKIRVENLQPMGLRVWHSLSTQLRLDAPGDVRQKLKGFLSRLLGSRK